MNRFTVSLARAAVFLFTLAAFAQAPSASPEDPVTALVNTALANSPGIRAQRQRLEAAKQRPSQARALPDPTADVEFMMLSVNHFDAKDALSKGVSVGVTQDLPYFGKRKLLEEKALREVDVAQAELRVMESELKSEASSAAYRYALYQALLALNSQTQEALGASAKGAAGLYASGSGTQSDLLLAQTAATKNQAGRRDLEEQLEITLARLKALLGGIVDENLLATVRLPEPWQTPSIGDLSREAVQAAPRILLAKARVSTFEKEVEIKKRDAKPDFMAGARYRHNDVTMGGGDFLTAMAGMSLPFFHRKDRYRPAIEESLFQREAAREEAENVTNEVIYDLAEDYQRAVRDRSVYGLYKEGLLIQAQQAYTSSLAAYSVGKADFTTLLRALTDYYDFQGAALMAQADFPAAVARIEATTGTSLPEPAVAGVSSNNAGAPK